MKKEWTLWIAGAALIGLAVGARITADRAPHGAVDLAPNNARVVLEVSGMACTSCATTVEAMLTRTPGVTRAGVNVDSAEAVIDYDAARVAPPDLLDIVNRLGYKAVVKDRPADDAG